MAKGTQKARNRGKGSSLDPEAADYLRSYRRIVMYEDLNSAGTIFGGKLVAWIDEGSAIYASCQMNARRIVTVKISELIFNQPAKLGDMLEIWCKVTRKGRTSITISTIVTRRSFADDPANPKSVINDYVLKPESEICRCELVFVCVDEKGRPRVWNKEA
ncbi:MAG TPA: hotdog domain-containing protein [Bdellovibrionota bacterium]|jgi:acyl-CoA hydrolase